jgi:membrane-associated phospholipid phosphatase
MNANHDDRGSNLLAGAVSRRAAVRGIGGAGAATVFGLATHRRAGADDGDRVANALFGASPHATAAPPIEPGAGTWKTWILASGDQLRPSAPPDAAATDAEMDRISYWDAGSPGYRWNEIATQQTQKASMGPDAYRVLAHLNAAIYDATVAAWDAKYAYDRARPIACDPALKTAIPTPNSPSYPCEHAAAAGAAATVLASFFPDAADDVAALAEEAARSRLEAGVVHPSDAAAGLALGRQVGELAITRAEGDGSDAEFDPATMPTGPGIWSPDAPAANPAGAPILPLYGTWKTWVLESGDQFRPGPPPAPDSPERAAEVEEIKDYPRDAHPFTELWFWPQDPAGRPAPDSAPFSSNQAVLYFAPVLHFLWGPELAQKLFEYRWDANPPRAARAYALVSIASYEATVACWDAKFFYWTARPNQFDPEIATVLPTYPIPDYPSGHATGLAGTAEVLAYLFPRDAHFFQSRADENAASRMWAGIHFRSACEVGVNLGRDVGQAVIARAMTDGAD